MDKLINDLYNSYKEEKGISFINNDKFPDKNAVISLLNSILEIFYLEYSDQKVTKKNLKSFLKEKLSDICQKMTKQIYLSFAFEDLNKKKESPSNPKEENKYKNICHEILNTFASIRKKLGGDIASIFQGDPAANSLEEVVISYPGAIAIATYRLAHEFYIRKVALIPRIMAEYAHMKTGIDIHPGATIGDNFFIDHGTGIVIGETSIIGNNVKIYQSVTLGGVSPAKGQSLKETKRHPTIEDDVIIYAAATILGNITIGKGSIIGGNVWLKNSISPNTIVTSPEVELIQKRKKT